ncbi:hypothetical protein BpHYR1_029906, partial [Brachionus plicatilis]
MTDSPIRLRNRAILRISLIKLYEGDKKEIIFSKTKKNKLKINQAQVYCYFLNYMEFKYKLNKNCSFFDKLKLKL